MAPPTSRRKPARSKSATQSPTAIKTSPISTPILPNGKPRPSMNRQSRESSETASSTTSSSGHRKRKRPPTDATTTSPTQRTKSSPTSPLTPLNQSPESDLPVHHSLNLRYRILSVLGHGHFSTTYLCSSTTGPSPVAIKRFHLPFTAAGEAEASHLASLPPSSRIICLLDRFTTTHLHLVLEPLDSSRPLSLPACSCLTPHKPLQCPLRHRALAITISQILTGLWTMHRSGLLHADLTPSNILYLSKTSSDIKLLDLSNCLTPAEAALPDDFEIQTPCYRAPEVLLGSAKTVGRKIDVWSAGIIALELLLEGEEVIGDGVEGAELLRSAGDSREGLVRRLVECFGSVMAHSCGMFWSDVYGEISYRWAKRPGEEKRAVNEKTGEVRRRLEACGDQGLVQWLMCMCEVAPEKRCTIAEALRNRWLVEMVWGEWGVALMGGAREDRDEIWRDVESRQEQDEGEGEGGGEGGDEYEDEEERVMLV